jgi:hypothetical protein
MLKVNNRVRHRNPEIDKINGVMIIRKIKVKVAICGYNDFDKVHQIFKYPLSELKITNN